ncbi:unannotated protein [freshwater metagenome]|uniref:Unannotated protein n=1 Tax=freshwater metagenome TaxID=449393 RepID=A0A6J7K9V8_9ZZZZ
MRDARRPPGVGLSEVGQRGVPSGAVLDEVRQRVGRRLLVGRVALAAHAMAAAGSLASAAAFALAAVSAALMPAAEGGSAPGAARPSFS